MMKKLAILTVILSFIFVVTPPTMADENVRVKFKNVWIGEENKKDPGKINCPILIKPGTDGKNRYCKGNGSSAKFRADAVCVKGVAKGQKITFLAMGSSGNVFKIKPKAGMGPLPLNCDNKDEQNNDVFANKIVCTIGTVNKGEIAYLIEGEDCDLDPRIIISDEQVDLTDKDKKKRP